MPCISVYAGTKQQSKMAPNWRESVTPGSGDRLHHGVVVGVNRKRLACRRKSYPVPQIQHTITGFVTLQLLSSTLESFVAMAQCRAQQLWMDIGFNLPMQNGKVSQIHRKCPTGWHMKSKRNLKSTRQHWEMRLDRQLPSA